MRGFHIEYGREAEHAALLKSGLATLPDDFAASVCFMCQGQGQYEQTYTAGCGGGYYKATGPCDCCGSTGLRQGDGYSSPAPVSVIEQVLNAGRAAMNQDLDGISPSNEQADASHSRRAAR